MFHDRMLSRFWLCLISIAIAALIRADFVYRTFNETDGIRVSVETICSEY